MTTMHPLSFALFLLGGLAAYSPGAHADPFWPAQQRDPAGYASYIVDWDPRQSAAYPPVDDCNGLEVIALYPYAISSMSCSSGAGSLIQTGGDNRTYATNRDGSRIYVDYSKSLFPKSNAAYATTWGFKGPDCTVGLTIFGQAIGSMRVQQNYCALKGGTLTIDPGGLGAAGANINFQQWRASYDQFGSSQNSVVLVFEGNKYRSYNQSPDTTSRVPSLGVLTNFGGSYNTVTVLATGPNHYISTSSCSSGYSLKYAPAPYGWGVVALLAVIPRFRLLPSDDPTCTITIQRYGSTGPPTVFTVKEKTVHSGLSSGAASTVTPVSGPDRDAYEIYDSPADSGITNAIRLGPMY